MEKEGFGPWLARMMQDENLPAERVPGHKQPQVPPSEKQMEGAQAETCAAAFLTKHRALVDILAIMHF